MAKSNLFNPGDGELDLRFLKFIGLKRPYINSFKRAASIVMSSISPKKVGVDGELLFSAVYLYRHAIELQLKYIITLGIDLGEIPKTEIHGHSLYELWKTAFVSLKANWDRAELKEIRAAIRQLYEADKSGQEFRYNRTIEWEKVFLDLPRREMQGEFEFESSG